MTSRLPRIVWPALVFGLVSLLALACAPREQTPAAPGTSAPKAPAAAVDDPLLAMQGRWTVDIERLPEQGNFIRMPEQQRTLALEMARNLLGSMTVEFTADRYSFTTGGKSVAGSYTITARGERELTLELTEDGTGAKEPMGLTVDSRGLLMKAAEDEVLPLRRKEGEPEANAKP